MTEFKYINKRKCNPDAIVSTEIAYQLKRIADALEKSIK